MSARRRPGRHLAARVRERRRAVLRDQWRFALGSVAGLVAMGVVFTTAMALLSGREAAFFFAGVTLGLGVAAATFFTYVEPVSARLQSGLDGESNTADQLARLRRRGWRAVHNIHLASGDIDHVAVGPGGVVAIETKSSSAEWVFLEQKGVVENWAKQAEQSAFRARHLIKQRTGLDTVPRAVVVTWVPGQPDGPDQIGKSAVRVRGKLLADYLRSLEGNMTQDTVDRVATQLDQFGAQLDEAAGVRTSWWRR